MARTLSTDLRARVIAAVDGGLSRRAAAERFGIGVATAIRWVRTFRATGSISAQAKGGDLRSYRIETHRDAILAAIVSQVDITIVELAELWPASMACTWHAARYGAS
jgi:transposase